MTFHLYSKSIAILLALGSHDFTPPPPAPVAIQKPYLYSVKKDSKLSYLFGTIHVGVTLDELPDFVLSALSSRPAFANEAGDLTKRMVDDPSTQKTYDNWDRLSERVRSQLLSIEYLGQHPDLAKLIINSAPYEQLSLLAYLLASITPGEFLTGLQMMDNDLLRLALKKGTPVTGLDTPELESEQEKSLAATSSSIEELFKSKTVSDLRQDFQKQMERYRNGSDVSDQDSKDLIVQKRNAAWIPSIEKLHAAGGVSVVVGAGHLGGPHGLIQLLKEKGFDIQQVLTRDDFIRLQ